MLKFANDDLCFMLPGGHQEYLGFVGCIRRLFVQFDVENNEEITCRSQNEARKCNGIVLDTCQMDDK